MTRNELHGTLHDPDIGKSINHGGGFSALASARSSVVAPTRRTSLFLSRPLCRSNRWQSRFRHPHQGVVGCLEEARNSSHIDPQRARVPLLHFKSYSMESRLPASDPRSMEHSIALSTEGSNARAQTLGGPPLIDAHNLTGYSPTQQEIRIDELCREANRLPFDFSSGRLSHISLHTLSSTRHALLINQSALCADATSLRILVREIALAYSARIARCILSSLQ